MRGLLIDDDETYCRVLQRSLQRRAVELQFTRSVDAALTAAREGLFNFCLIDLKLGSDSGLMLIEPLRELHPNMKIILVTGYASVATAVEAIKRGADNYLAKPVTAGALLRALKEEPQAAEPDMMTPLGRLEWEHIQQALRECDGNISAAARLLGVHRRSLQRKLAKKPTVHGSRSDT